MWNGPTVAGRQEKSERARKRPPGRRLTHRRRPSTSSTTTKPLPHRLARRVPFHPFIVHRPFTFCNPRRASGQGVSTGSLRSAPNELALPTTRATSGAAVPARHGAPFAFVGAASDAIHTYVLYMSNGLNTPCYEYTCKDGMQRTARPMKCRLGGKSSKSSSTKARSVMARRPSATPLQKCVRCVVIPAMGCKSVCQYKGARARGRDLRPDLIMTQPDAYVLRTRIGQALHSCAEQRGQAPGHFSSCLETTRTPLLSAGGLAARPLGCCYKHA
ncbi:hypothetical protein IWX90DRAFT_160003 [Phyllosticta citrichinensis]|uniref:Uncharacterized protein n=1 Tax=Phyllosticta citrichinensis TaxID=1130410 RepID=A0ABR1Y0K5_9PEZI